MAQMSFRTAYIGLASLAAAFCMLFLASTHAQASWTSGGPHNSFVLDLAIDPTFSGTVFAAIKGEHVAKTINGGASWDYLYESYTDRGAVAIDPQNPSTVYAGKGWAQVTNLCFSLNKSMDGGASWASTGFLFCKEGIFECAISDIWVKPSDSNVILATVAGFGDAFYPGGVYKSTDGGDTWARTYPFWVNTLAVDPIDYNKMYFGTSKNGYVFQSVDGGSTWASMDPGWGSVSEVRDIEVDRNSQLYAATNEGLWKWGGFSWTKLSGLPTEQITALAIERSKIPGIIYVGTIPEGVFVSLDGGSTFVPFNEGLENLSIIKLALSSGQPKIVYAGTALGGVWSWAYYEPGDINGDGCVDLADAILALQVLVGIRSESFHNADVNGDANIGIQDVLYILQKAAGER